MGVLHHRFLRLWHCSSLGASPSVQKSQQRALDPAKPERLFADLLYRRANELALPAAEVGDYREHPCRRRAAAG